MRFKLAVIAVLTMFIMTGCSANVVQKDSLEQGKAGRAVEHNGYIYYINGAPSMYMPEDFHNVKLGALCRMKIDGSEKQVIVPMITTVFNVAEDKLYFVAMDSGTTFVMASSNLDGSEYKELGEIGSGVYQYTKGGLYYSKNGKLEYSDLSGKHKKTIIDEQFKQYLMDDKYIYYTVLNGSDPNIYYTDSKGKKHTLIYDGAANLLEAKDGWVYFSELSNSKVFAVNAETKQIKTIIYTAYETQLLDLDNDLAFGALPLVTSGINMTKISSGETKKISDKYTKSMTMGKDCIYFVNEDDNRYIYKAPFDGSGDVKICEKKVYNEQMILLGDYLYFLEKDTQNLYRINVINNQLEDIMIN